MILIPSVTEEQLLHADGQCSSGYVMIYTSHELEITCVSHSNIFSQLSEKLLSLTQSPIHQVLVNI